MAIEYKLIESAPFEPYSHLSVGNRYFEKLNFDSLFYSYRSRNDDKDRFINYDGLHFQSEVGCKRLTGNELLFYPELAEKLRLEPHYPTFCQDYDVDKQASGLAFLSYFNAHVHACHADFEAKLTEINIRANNLIMLYGQKRYQPIINALDKDERNNAITGLIINGTLGAVDNSHWQPQVTGC
ncbi:MAG: hypothetical protein HKM04_03930 [Legionellales bacterium]|nr:hypothetical protein [Legionellales bacterium]